MGFGAQIGADITDFVIILNTPEAVAAFSKGGNLTFGGNLQVSAGPIGAGGEAGIAAVSTSPIFAYCKSKGLFAGLSLEGSALIEMKDINEKFYKQSVQADGRLCPLPSFLTVTWRFNADLSPCSRRSALW